MSPHLDPTAGDGGFPDAEAITRARERMLNVLVPLCCFGFWFFLPNTQLRVGSVGVSEFFGFLAVLLAAASPRLMFTREMLVASVVHVLLVAFTFLKVFSAGPGLEGALRDIVAVTYSLLAAISVANLMGQYPEALRSSIFAMAACVLLYSIILVVALSGNAGPKVWFVEVDAAPQEVELFGDAESVVPRFIGLSGNPNQLAFFLAFVAFFVPSMSRLIMLKHPVVTVIASAGLGAVLLAATQSDGALLASIAGVSFLFLHFVYRYSGLWKVCLIYVGLVSVVLSAPLVWKWGLGEDGGGGRLPLWRSALDLFDEAKGVGLGYGAYLSTDVGVLYEAHSLPLDLMLGAGAIGFGIAFLLVAYYCFLSMSCRDPKLLVPALVVVVFSLTYSPMRHPLFWIALFLPSILRRSLNRFPAPS